MGEYAEYQLAFDMRRGFPASKHGGAKSPIGGYCTICGKGIRTIDGSISHSIKAHMKDKHGVRQ